MSSAPFYAWLKADATQDEPNTVCMFAVGGALNSGGVPHWGS
jgi:hypothetical protein